MLPTRRACEHTRKKTHKQRTRKQQHTNKEQTHNQSTRKVHLVPTASNTRVNGSSSRKTSERILYILWVWVSHVCWGLPVFNLLADWCHWAWNLVGSSYLENFLHLVQVRNFGGEITAISEGCNGPLVFAYKSPWCWSLRVAKYPGLAWGIVKYVSLNGGKTTEGNFW